MKDLDARSYNEGYRNGFIDCGIFEKPLQAALNCPTGLYSMGYSDGFYGRPKAFPREQTCEIQEQS